MTWVEIDVVLVIACGVLAVCGPTRVWRGIGVVWAVWFTALTIWQLMRATP